MVGINNELGMFLKEQREKRGLSLEYVEDQTKISINYIDRIEKGYRTKPSYIVLERLSTLYNLDLKEMIKLTKDK